MHVEQEYKLTLEEEMEKIFELKRQMERESNRELEESIEEENCKPGRTGGIGKNYSSSSKKRYKQVKPYF